LFGQMVVLKLLQRKTKQLLLKLLRIYHFKLIGRCKSRLF
jgi:hypothetical protein